MRVVLKDLNFLIIMATGLYPQYNTDEVSELLGKVSYSLNDSRDLDPLLEYIGDAKYVLLGSACHGSHEYCKWRMKITQRLIDEKNFSFVAMDGDWPDCYKVNRFVKRYPYSGESAFNVLKEFNRWPTWLLANWEMVAFIDWLKSFNEKLTRAKRVGFYGLDVYSFWEAMETIVKYLEKKDKDALSLLEKELKCFESYSMEERKSAALVSSFVPGECEKEVLNLLNEIGRKISHYSSDVENTFSTEQNEMIALTVEKYYRALMHNGAQPRIIRDRYMLTTLNRLVDFHGENAKAIVWENNTHVGDTCNADGNNGDIAGMGQLIMKKYAKDGVVAVGFGSYNGSMIAGKKWGDEMRKIDVPDAIVGSWEHAFHLACKGKNKLLMMNRIKDDGCISSHIDHRTIGVIYDPEDGNFGNYKPTIIPARYDAFVFLDEVNALHPLHISPNGEQLPEAYPFGL